MDILEHEAPRVHAATEKAQKQLQVQLGGARSRIVEKRKQRRREGVSDLMSDRDSGRTFKELDDHATSRAGKQHMSELVDLPDLQEGKVWFTNAQGIHLQMSREEREERLAARVNAGKPRPGQLDDSAARPAHAAALPLTFSITVGLVAVVTIARTTRQLTVQRTVEWLGSTAISLVLRWLLLDPLKVAALAPVKAWAIRRKMRQMEQEDAPLLADMLLRAAAVLEGGGTGETDRLRRTVKRVVDTNRAIDELQQASVLRAARRAKMEIKEATEKRLEASLRAALAGVEGGATADVKTMREALQLKKAQQQKELAAANEQLDAELTSMVTARVEDWEHDLEERAADGGRLDRQWMRMMKDYDTEASQLEASAAASKARLEIILQKKREDANQARQLANDKQMKARVRMMVALLQRHQAKIDAIVMFGRPAEEDQGFWFAEDTALASARKKQQQNESSLSVVGRMRAALLETRHKTKVIDAFLEEVKEEEEEVAAVVEEDTAMVALRAKLQKLRPVALHKRAMVEGVDPDLIGEVMAATDDPKDALVELLVAHQTKKKQKQMQAQRHDSSSSNATMGASSKQGESSAEEALRDKLWSLRIEALHKRAMQHAQQGAAVEIQKIMHDALSDHEAKGQLINLIVKLELLDPTAAQATSQSQMCWGKRPQQQQRPWKATQHAASAVSSWGKRAQSPATPVIKQQQLPRGPSPPETGLSSASSGRAASLRQIDVATHSYKNAIPNASPTSIGDGTSRVPVDDPMSEARAMAARVMSASAGKEEVRRAQYP